ncbi:sialoadhesin [Brachyhypopomus gauderio]|uniref:sialoadhesin n=1 Tax=Brachyhypopomus gauderio TaxID=698409 RepID=UPI004041FF2F
MSNCVQTAGMSLRSTVLISVIMFFQRGAPALMPSAPDRVSAQLGSCALLPCSFEPHSTTGQVDIRLRYRSSFMSLRSVAFSSDAGELQRSVQKHFAGRVALVGTLTEGDCSLIITNVSAKDPDVYEVQLKEQGRTWGKAKTVHLSVTNVPEQPMISAPQTVVAGKVSVLNCSVKVSCPSQPPRLQWVWERGGLEDRSVPGEEVRVQGRGQLPTLHSSLSFTAPHLVMPRVRCEAVYPGNKKSSTTRELRVNFPPTDVSIEITTLSVREGGRAQVACLCKADPPVTGYRWSLTQSGDTVTLMNRTPTIDILNVTRDTRVQCTVWNILGKGSSRPTTLNVQYTPVIVHNSSSCEWDGRRLACKCLVNSNPRPAVTWSVNGSVPPHDYNLTNSYSHNTLQESLQGWALTPLPVVCYAINSLGNDSHVLMQDRKGEVLWSLLPPLCGLFSLLFLLLILVLWGCRAGRSRRRRVAAYGPPVFPDSVNIYQDHIPLYINTSEVSHIYTNGSYQLVYQNCTPYFVRSKQVHKRQRRGARRQRRHRERDRPGPAGQTERDRQLPSSTDVDTAVYVEVI